MLINVIVEYTKGQHLYRILVPSAHILLSFCIRIGTFDCSRVLYLCRFFEFRAHSYRGSCPESECRSLWLMAAVVERSREVLLCEGTFAETVVPVPLSSVPVPLSRKSTVTYWYRYHSHRYRYPKAGNHQ